MQEVAILQSTTSLETALHLQSTQNRQNTMNIIAEDCEATAHFFRNAFKNLTSKPGVSGSTRALVTLFSLHRIVTEIYECSVINTHSCSRPTCRWIRNSSCCCTSTDRICSNSSFRIETPSTGRMCPTLRSISR